MPTATNASAQAARRFFAAFLTKTLVFHPVQVMGWGEGTVTTVLWRFEPTDPGPVHAHLCRQCIDLEQKVIGQNDRFFFVNFS